MIFVGGTYYEQCIHPRWEQLFGSGLRGAIASCSIVDDVRFYTRVGKEFRDDLEYLTSDNGIVCDYHLCDRTVTFKYFHPLSSPSVVGEHVFGGDITHVDADVVVRFGALDHDYVVKGKKVVYDPQGEVKRVFSDNGSTAERLAVVLNDRESREFSCSKDVSGRAKDVCNIFNAEVVVIKCGPLGAFVYYLNEVKSIPCYNSGNVFSIGSGDVFTSIFSCYWASKNVDPFLAAEYASRAVSHYCSTRDLNFSDEGWMSKGSPVYPIQGKVYLAGPFFDVSQRWLVEDLYNAFKHHDIDVFSPLHHVGFSNSFKNVALLDLQGLDESDVVFAILNGHDVGTIFEIGYAVAKCKKVVVFYQGNINSDDLTMINESGCLLFSDLTTAFYNTVWGM